MAEPPSFGLLLAATTTQAFPDQQLFWQALLGLGFLFLSSAFSAALLILSKRASEQLDSAEQASYVPDIASAQVGRTVAAFLYVLLFISPLKQLFDLLLSPVSSLLWLSPVLAFSTLVCLFVLFVLQFAKVVATAFPDVTFRFFRRPLQIWKILSYPFWAGIVRLMRSINLPIQRSDVDVQMGFFRQLIDEEAKRQPNDGEKQLIKNVLDFNEVDAHDVMVPRPDVVWLSSEDSLDIILEQMQESGHTRFPLCEGTADNVIGYLHAKDLAFLQPSLLPAPIDVKQLARPIAFVPETAQALALLERFRSERSHMAIVVDEFGGMSGIVTMEDLLEELVGEIQDEFDAEDADVKALTGGDLLVDGGVHLEELEESLGLYFGEVEEDTLGGYIFGRLAREVEVGDVIDIPGANLQVVEVDGLRVTKVRLSQKKKKQSLADGEKTGSGSIIATSLFFD